MTFKIEKYLDSLPENISIINIAGKDLEYIPDLSRFKNLKELNCSFNLLKELPRLNDTIEVLYCHKNLLISLPKLPNNLTQLYCYDNKLTKLPQLNEKLLELYCYWNDITELPKINKYLKKLYCFSNILTMIPIIPDDLTSLDFSYNPIHDIIYTRHEYNENNEEIIDDNDNDNSIDKIKNRIRLLNNFKYSYYSLKCKNKLRKFLWERIREHKIQKQYSPENLNNLLNSMKNENDEDELDYLINSW
jgi:hypothetical protein